MHHERVLLPLLKKAGYWSIRHLTLVRALLVLILALQRCCEGLGLLSLVGKALSKSGRIGYRGRLLRRRPLCLLNQYLLHGNPVGLHLLRSVLDSYVSFDKLHIKRVLAIVVLKFASRDIFLILLADTFLVTIVRHSLGASLFPLLQVLFENLRSHNLAVTLRLIQIFFAFITVH